VEYELSFSKHFTLLQWQALLPIQIFVKMHGGDFNELVIT
jgi:hypothetical protein